jgi:DASH complex subunit DAM1
LFNSKSQAIEFITSTMSTPSTQSRSRSRSRSNSRTRSGNIPSRPATPLRPSSRASLRASLQAASTSHLPSAPGVDADPNEQLLNNPLAILEPQFAEFSDAMADLEANMLHLQIMTESLSRFSESFASFLYGLGMNAFCVDWMEMPNGESWRVMEAKDRRERLGLGGSMHLGGDHVGDATFLTTDTSFVEHPPASSKPSSKFSTPKASGRQTGPGAAAGVAQRGRGGRGIPRASGIARGSTRGSTAGRGTRGAARK